jgi:hypothetical protein
VKRALPVLGAMALSACCGIHITPDSLRKSAPADAELAIGAWLEAVALANEFLASPLRKTLPAGTFELDDQAGMTFVTERGRLPMEVWWTPWGDVTLWTGGAAQEASYGFVVGRRNIEGRTSNRVLDNSFFRGKSGDWHAPSDIAKMILHETTHVVHGVGAFGFWSSISYYLELVFLFRSSTSSHERAPRATSEEFMWFLLLRGEASEDVRKVYEMTVQEHLEKGGPNCEHGEPRYNP